MTNDRDPLLALGPQPVGQQRQIQRALAAAPLARRFDVLQLVLEDLLAVVQQPADQRALAVIDRSRGGEAQQVERHEAARRIRSTRPSYGPPSRPPSPDRRRASLRAR